MSNRRPSQLACSFPARFPDAFDSNVIGSGPIASAPDANLYSAGVLFVDNTVNPSVLYRDSYAYRSVSAAYSVADYSEMSKPMCFVKHMDDYVEYSVYMPTDNSGANFARMYFGNRLNVGNAGFPRLNASMFATLAGTIGVDAFTESNASTHLNSFLDVIMGTGNIEYAVRTREYNGASEDFVSGIHGKETLESFDLFIDGVSFSYSSAVVGTKTVCNELKFVAKTKIGYPSNATDYWCNITYTGILKNGIYSIQVDTEVTKQSDVQIDYVAILMSPGSAATAKYGSGFDTYAIANTDYTLDQFDGVVYTIPSFAEASFRSSTHIVAVTYPTIQQTLASPFVLNPLTVGRLTSRTDKYNKIYFQSKNEAWDVYPIGYRQTAKSNFIIRSGDTSAFSWNNFDARKWWVPIS